MSKSERWSSAKPALIYLTPLETRCPPFSPIRHGTREENPLSVPRHVLSPSNPAHWDTFKTQIVALSELPPARTRPRPLADPSPGVSQRPPHRAAPSGPYLPCRAPGPAAAAVSPPSLGRRQLGSARAAPGAPSRGNGNRNSSGAAAAGGAAGGIPDTWEPRAGKLRLLRSKGVSYWDPVGSRLSSACCCGCPGGRRGQSIRRWRDAGVFHVQNALFDFIIYF